MRADIAGCVGMNDVFAFRDEFLVLCGGDDLWNIITDGFRQARGVDRNDVRLIYRKDIMNGLEQVALAAEYGRAFGE